MAQVCRVCTHPERFSIDSCLLQGTCTPGQIAVRYGFSKSGVHRHKRNHITEQMRSLAKRVEAIEGQQILAVTVGLAERAFELLAVAEGEVLRQREAGEIDPKAMTAAAAAMREARSVVGLLAQVNDSTKQEARDDTSTVRIDIEQEIERALNRRGARPQGPQAHATVRGPLALPAAHEVEDAEIVE